MKQGLLSAILITVFFLMAVPGAFSAEKVRITAAEFPPYQSLNEEFYGSANRVITEAFALSGIDVEYGWFPWSRAYFNAQGGNWNGVAVAQRTPEREAEFYFSDPIFSVKKVFFHLKNYVFNWANIDDLTDVHIAAGLGINYGDEFQLAEQQGDIEVFRLESMQQAFTMMLEGRIDIVPAGLVANYYLLEQQFATQLAEFTHHPLPVQEVQYHLLLSRQDSHSLENMKLFNLGLRKLREAGKVSQFLEEGF